jgi:DNA-binding MurR/RpiR family transcriptional regulator
MNPSSAVRDAIEGRYAALTGQQRRAADYLLAHRRTAFAMSVHELARAAEVSEATLVRLARELGFGGYQGLRAALMEEAKRDLAPEDRFAFEEPSAEPAGTLARVAAQEVGNINRTLEQLEPARFRGFVDRLRRADLVATAGLGVSAMLARLAAYSLFQIGMRAEVLVREAVTLIEQVDRLPRGTVLWIFGLPPYSRQSVDAAGHARRRKVPVLVITDEVRSPLAPLATEALYVRTDNVLFTNALGACLTVTNAIVTELALAGKSRALRQVRAANRVAADEYLDRPMKE